MIRERFRHFSNNGSSIHIKYQLQLMEDGTHDVVPVGKENRHDEIESHQAACSINAILERYKHGDTEAINRVPGNYFDASNMPTDAFQIYRLVQNGRYMFDNLPVDIRGEFNHSYDEFIASLGSDRFEKILAGKAAVEEAKKKVQKEMNEVKQEVKTNEPKQ